MFTPASNLGKYRQFFGIFLGGVFWQRNPDSVEYAQSDEGWRCLGSAFIGGGPKSR